MQPDKLPNRGVFAIELDQERQFYGRADHVISVSLQEYATESFIVTPHTGIKLASLDDTRAYVRRYLMPMVTP